MKVDILAFGAHPDDIELGAGGTLVHHIKKGQKAAIVDLTQGDLGTRGTVELRREEADAAGEIMGLTARENLKFRDGFFVNDEEHQLEVIRMIRKYRPEIVIANAIRDRHPDHKKGSDLVSTSGFLAGLKILRRWRMGSHRKLGGLVLFITTFSFTILLPILL